MERLMSQSQSHEFDLIISTLELNGARLDTLSAGLGDVARNCATLLERTAHLATREDVTAAIRLHASECKTNKRNTGDIPKSLIPPYAGSGAKKLIRALALFFATAAAAIGSYLGFRD